MKPFGKYESAGEYLRRYSQVKIKIEERVTRRHCNAAAEFFSALYKRLENITIEELSEYNHLRRVPDVRKEVFDEFAATWINTRGDFDASAGSVGASRWLSSLDFGYFTGYKLSEDKKAVLDGFDIRAIHARTTHYYSSVFHNGDYLPPVKYNDKKNMRIIKCVEGLAKALDDIKDLDEILERHLCFNHSVLTDEQKFKAYMYLPRSLWEGYAKKRSDGRVNVGKKPWAEHMKKFNKYKETANE